MLKAAVDALCGGFLFWVAAAAPPFTMPRMARLPNSERSILDPRKIEDYCLDAAHPRGRHKARLFRELLDLRRSDAGWLRGILLREVQKTRRSNSPGDVFGDRWAGRYSDRATPQERCDKNHMDHTDRRDCAPVRKLLGAVMMQESSTGRQPALLDVVALLADVPGQGLARGQVGTVVEPLDDRTVLVEFVDDQGRAYAIAPCPWSELLVLHYVPQAA
jgi:hypothetical protein